MSSQDKEEYDVGIPIDDLSSGMEPPEPDSNGTEDEEHAANPEEEEGTGLPSLFDEDELAEVGLKAAPFDDAAPYPTDNNTELGAGTDEMESDNDGTGIDGLPEATPADGDIDTRVEDFEPFGQLSGDGDIDSENLDIEGLTKNEVPPPLDDLPAWGPDTNKLQQEIGLLNARLAELKDEFSGKLKYDEHKDKIIDKLHQELQEYKEDIVKKHILSIVLDVVKVADDIRKWLAYFRSLDVSQRDPVKLFRYLEAIPSDLEDIFYWQGVKPFTSREGTFNPARQRTVKKIPTNDLSKDKTIAKSLRPGYEWEEKVIRQEMVAVYVFEDDPESVDTRDIDE